MSGRAQRRRGQPLAALAAIVVVWTGVRAGLWEQPFPVLTTLAPAPPATGARRPVIAVQAELPLPATQPAFSAPKSSVVLEVPAIPVKVVGQGRAVTDPAGYASAPEITSWAPSPVAGPAAEGLTATFPGGRRRESTDLALAPLPKDPGTMRARAARAWRVDGWALWRAGGGAASPAATVARYGGSQVGATARWALGAGAPLPQLAARAAHAPGRLAQSELAIGASARPVGGLPLRLQVEGQAIRSAGRTEVRPAVLAISELPVLALPGGASLEAYAQAGWVGGANATAFADGQVRFDGKLADFGSANMRLGGGAWGGVQRGAGRLDVGPGATLDLREAGVPARISLDYRFRIAGQAAPGSGPVITLSTGF